MRVLLISHTCQSRTEGQPRADYLARIQNVQVRVLSPDRWRHYGKLRFAESPANTAHYDYEAARVAWPWCGPAQFYLHWYPRLKRTIETFRPDIIDLWEEPWGLVSAHACRVRNRCFPSIKVVCETEQNVYKQLPHLFESFRSYTHQSADYMVGRNHEAIQLLRRKGYRGEAEVVPNAVDTSVFHPADRRKCRQSLGFDGFVVGYVGRLVEEKGLLDLLAALSQCPTQVQLIFVGDGPLQPELERQIAARRLSHRVHFRPPMAHPELATLFNSLDALALVSRTTPRWKEQFGRVIIEAHACAVPVIGSCSGAIPDVVGRGGLLVPEADSSAIANAIKRLCAAPELVNQLGCAGLEQVRTNYTWERVAARMHAIYCRMLEGTSAAEAASAEHNLYA